MLVQPLLVLDHLYKHHVVEHMAIALKLHTQLVVFQQFIKAVQAHAQKVVEHT